MFLFVADFNKVFPGTLDVMVNFKPLNACWTGNVSNSQNTFSLKYIQSSVIAIKELSQLTCSGVLVTRTWILMLGKRINNQIFYPWGSNIKNVWNMLGFLLKRDGFLSLNGGVMELQIEINVIQNWF